MATEVSDDLDLKDEVRRLRAELTKLTRANDDLSKSLREASSEHDKLDQKLRETKAEAMDRRHEAKQLKEEREAAEGRLRALQAERDQAATTLAEREKEFGEFKAQAEAQPNALLEQVNDLKGKLRQNRHEGAYQRVARTLKVDVDDPVKFNDLLSAAKYAALDDEPDEAKIAETFKQAVEKRPWLLVPEPAPTPPAAPHGQQTNGQANGHAPATTLAPAKPGPGADRGAPADAGRPTLAQVRIPGRL